MKNYFSIGVIVVLIFAFQTTYSQSRKIKICTGGVCNAGAIYFPQPDYPMATRMKNISGVVSVRVSVDEQGNVTSAETCSGHPLLRPEAEKAAMKAKFKPTILSGQPVRFVCILLYKFNLNEEIVEGGIVNVKATYFPQPDYPQEAKDFCASGIIRVEVEIDGKGDVISAKAISGHELLHKSAVEAAKKAKFQPTTNRGVPIKIKGIIVYNFVPEIKCLVVGIVNKKALSIPKPQIPNLNQPKHLQIKEEQIVTVQIIIDESGKVVRARAISGHPLLRAACENSARQAKFSPSFIDGATVKISALLVYKFKPDGTIDTGIKK